MNSHACVFNLKVFLDLDEFFLVFYLWLKMKRPVYILISKRYRRFDVYIYFSAWRVCVFSFPKPGVRELVLIASVRPVDLRV